MNLIDPFNNKSTTTRKLTNTNRNINGIFSSINYGEFFWLNMPLQYLSINTNRNILSVYTKGITVRKE
jgi:hypothetical protein